MGRKTTVAAADWATGSGACLGTALLLALVAASCQLLPILDEEPTGPPPPPPCPEVEGGRRLCGRCASPGAAERRACGPCLEGEGTVSCSEDGYWELVGSCEGNPMDRDGDGLAAAECAMLGRDCCGEEDCDDDDPETWSAGVDRDGDGHAFGCGGDDCDDDDPERWTGHADLDRDFHVAASCGGDDCDDDDPERWDGAKDLDGDGHVAVGCGGDDCDDTDPRRWTGRADLDGDGHVAVGCCDADGVCGDDCNDDDPEVWELGTDADRDGYADAGCCGADGVCGRDCDDDCWHCNPGPLSRRECAEDCIPGCRDIGFSCWAPDGRDHDCDGAPEELSGQAVSSGSTLCIEHVISEIPEPRHVYFTYGDENSHWWNDDNLFVTSAEGLHVLRVAEEEPTWEVSALHAIRGAQGMAVGRGFLFVAGLRGLFVVEAWSQEATPRLLAGPVPVGASEAVFVSGRYAYVATLSRLEAVDVRDPLAPVHVGGTDFVEEFGYQYYWPSDVFVRRGEAYVVTNGPAHALLHVVDLEDPASPAYQAMVSDYWGRSFGPPRGIFVNAEYLFAATEDRIQLMRPEQLLDEEHEHWREVMVDGPRDLFVVRDRAFVATEAGLRVIDLTDVERPVVTGSELDIGATWSVFVGRSRVFLAGERGVTVVRLDC